MEDKTIYDLNLTTGGMFLINGTQFGDNITYKYYFAVSPESNTTFWGPIMIGPLPNRLYVYKFESN